MKIKVLTIAAILLTVIACQDKTSIEYKKELRDELKETLKGTQVAIDSLTAQINALDTTAVKYKFQQVKIQLAVKDTFLHNVKVHGKVEATKNVLINPEVQGTITQILVKEGQNVTKGQTLITLDASIMENNIKELQSQLDFATQMFDKQQRLYDQNIGSEVQFLQAKNQKESLENSITTLTSQRGKYQIKSPISGVIDDIFPNSGEIASPGRPVIRVVNLDEINVVCDLSEKYLGKINIGDKVNVSFKSIDLHIKGDIIQIGQFIDENNRTFKIKVDLAGNNDLIKPNLLAVVEFCDYINPEVVSIPSKVILEDLKGKYVFVGKKENIEGEGEFMVARKKYVTLGMTSNGMVEIIDMEEDIEIIVVGYSDLVDGEKLKTN